MTVAQGILLHLPVYSGVVSDSFF